MKLFYKFILPLALFLFACLIAFGENGPTPKVVVGSSGISDGSITPAKISSGYNLLTDAEKVKSLTNYSSGLTVGSNYFVFTLTSGQIATLSVLLTEGNIPYTLQRGRIDIVSCSGVQGSACFHVFGSANSSVELFETATVFSATKGTVSATNIYSAGSGQYEIQNTHAGTLIYILTWTGA